MYQSEGLVTEAICSSREGVLEWRSGRGERNLVRTAGESVKKKFLLMGRFNSRGRASDRVVQRCAAARSVW